MDIPSAASPLRRLSAFTTDPAGGNPAGVHIAEALPDSTEMRRIAAEVGYSETAFVAPASDMRWAIRYYSPEAEVSFCGHATIATGVALAEQHGEGIYALETRVGVVSVEVRRRDGYLEAALTSVLPRHRAASRALVEEALTTLGWSASELDGVIPPALAYAGAWHLVLAAAMTTYPAVNFTGGCVIQ